MKKLIIALMVVSMLLVVIAAPVQAAKPTGNLAGAQKVAWNLSGAVMPSPPWGLSDIVGSDTASKLVVNQPNGNTEVAITGAMNGLNPNTEYTVYISKGWNQVWNVEGSWQIDLEYDLIIYPETLILTQSGTAITGVSLEYVPTASLFTVYDGSVIGDDVDIYANRGALIVHLEGIIAPDGSMSGEWHDEAPGTRGGTWETTSGNAVKIGGGYPGLFNTQETFTFTTDDLGAGSWHVNLKDADLPPGADGATHNLSVWINRGGTILISDNFMITKG